MSWNEGTPNDQVSDKQNSTLPPSPPPGIIIVELRRLDFGEGESPQVPCQLACFGCSGMEDDTVQLKASLNNVAIEAGVSVGCVSDDYVGEMVRFGAGELHVVAAIMGGIAAQEAIKLLTCQFIPLKGTLIYNGMSGTSLVL
jgi:hypothetical protein